MNRELILYYSLILLACVVAGFLGVVVLSRLFGKAARKNRMDMDLDFLDKLHSQLSPDEMKKVKEAMLRHAVQQDQQSETKGVEDLELMLKAGAIAPSRPKPPPAPPPAEKKTAPPPKKEPGPSGAVDIDLLLEKGLISPEEHGRLKALSGKES